MENVRYETKVSLVKKWCYDCVNRCSPLVVHNPWEKDPCHNCIEDPLDNLIPTHYKEEKRNKNTKFK